MEQFNFFRITFEIVAKNNVKIRNTMLSLKVIFSMGRKHKKYTNNRRTLEAIEMDVFKKSLEVSNRNRIRNDRIKRKKQFKENLVLINSKIWKVRTENINVNDCINTLYLRYNETTMKNLNKTLVYTSNKFTIVGE